MLRRLKDVLKPDSRRVEAASHAIASGTSAVAQRQPRSRRASDEEADNLELGDPRTVSRGRPDEITISTEPRPA